MREFTIAFLVGVAIYSAVIFWKLSKRIKKKQKWESENLDLDNLTTAILWIVLMSLLWIPMFYIMQLLDPILK